MRCPHCRVDDDKVIESRLLGGGTSIRRRRECQNCGYRFTSYENIEEKPFMVVKRNGQREPFEMAKLRKGIARALEKRPFSQQQIDIVVSEIFDEAVQIGENRDEVSTDELGDLVMQRLYKTDAVAYVRFASVYRRFNDIDEFVKIVREVRNDRRGQV